MQWRASTEENYVRDYTCSPTFPCDEFMLKVLSRNSRKQEGSFPCVINNNNNRWIQTN
ncbi:hypothetical protein HanRHA438_Chr09g0389911 [Helianthus annuus]|nr:hypothetical protein HanIR_Chr09g0407801 [Helianthus annuus]KAJ0887360.1 hypothetical protein HanRHA438_Chr09g0389911 [Helianthus annuus]